MVRSQLKKHQSWAAYAVRSLPSSGSRAQAPCHGVPALRADTLTGVRSHPPAHRAALTIGSLLPALLQCCQQPQDQAQAGEGSCQEQEDRAGKERGFQGQALS